MMSSAIPARLQFQCGHAAMVSLPRIKGETTAQRNERIAREKSSALTRECDFCAPAIVTALNGNAHVEETAHVDETPVVQEAPVVEEIVLVAEPTPVVVDETPVEIEVILAEQVTSDTDQVAPEVVAVVVEAPAVTVSEPVDEEVAAPTSEPVNGEAASTEPANGEAATAPRAIRRRAQRKPRAEEVARGRRFLVEYRVERVLHAVDIHDALRQASALGAAELTAITREG